jgi:hypothetical protein
MHKPRAAGVSPPWVGERTRIEHRRRLANAQTKSGGCQPAVLVNVLRRESNIVRSSARRGAVNARRATRQIVSLRQTGRRRARRGSFRFCTERAHSLTTAGLRQPLLAACASVVADMRFSPASMPVFPTAGLRQPLLVSRRMCGAVRRWTEFCDNYRRRLTDWGESNALGYEDSKPAAGS